MTELIRAAAAVARLLSDPSPHLEVETAEGAAAVELTEAQAATLIAAERPEGGEREVERRFLLGAVPAAIEGQPSKALVQGYLAVDPGASLRLRTAGGRTRLTLKRGKGLERTEVEIDLEAEQAAPLWPLCGSRRVEKTRHLVPDGDGTIELDVYAGRHQGLVVAEREFTGTDAARAWTPPPWCGPEITEDGRFTNAQLALGTLSPEILQAVLRAAP